MKIEAIRAMVEVNARFGAMSVTFGTLLPVKNEAGSHVIPPSWRPEGISKVDVK